MSGGLRRFAPVLVPAGLLVAAVPAAELAAAAAHVLGFGPGAVFTLLVAVAAGGGWAMGKTGRPVAGRAAAGTLPAWWTPPRVRGWATAGAAATAFLFGLSYIDEVRTRWNVEHLAAALPSVPPELAGKLVHFRFSPTQLAAFDAATALTGQPDSYLRGRSERAGVRAPAWLTRTIHHATPAFAAVVAGSVAWRVSRPGAVPAGGSR